MMLTEQERITAAVQMIHPRHTVHTEQVGQIVTHTVTTNGIDVLKLVTSPKGLVGFKLLPSYRVDTTGEPPYPWTDEEREALALWEEIKTRADITEPTPAHDDPTYDVRQDAEIFKSLKEANPQWTMDRVASEAEGLRSELGKKNADRVRYVYNQMGWKWERGDRIR